MKLLKITAAIATISMLGGCAAPSVAPPNDYTVDMSKTYSANFDSVWDSTVEWFAINDIPIKNIEKDSGIISSEYTLGSDYSQVDCGTVDAGGMHYLVDTSVVANINVLVREAGNGASVQPNIFGNGTAMMRDVWNGIPVKMELENCVSTGEIEKNLHQYLNKRL